MLEAFHQFNPKDGKRKFWLALFEDYPIKLSEEIYISPEALEDMRNWDKEVCKNCGTFNEFSKEFLKVNQDLDRIEILELGRNIDSYNMPPKGSIKIYSEEGIKDG